MIIDRIKRILYRKKWRNLNPYNETELSYPTDMNLVNVGRRTYGSINVDAYGNSCKLKIGKFCSIGPNVMFILNADHRVDTISTYPFRVKICDEEFEATSKGDIVVDDDVWIGYGVTVLSGVHIGQGAVVAAGAVVVSDVEPYSIVGGVPAKLIKKRFSKEIIQQLMTIDYDALSDDIIRENINRLYVTVKSGNDIDWIPKKG